MPRETPSAQAGWELEAGVPAGPPGGAPLPSGSPPLAAGPPGLFGARGRGSLPLSLVVSAGGQRALVLPGCGRTVRDREEAVSWGRPSGVPTPLPV